MAASPHNGTSVEPSPGFAFRRLASILGQRIGFGNKAGLSFQKADGSYARDTYAALGYPETIAYEAYREQYERGGIAKRLVEIYPRATWGGGADIREDPEPETETEFEREAKALFDRLDVWSRLLRVDILAGIGQYGALLIGAEGELDQPLPRLRGQASIASLAPLPEGRAKVEKLIEDDTSDPRFGLPEFYRVNLGGSKSQARKVHWSRVIHVAEGLLEDEVNGTPRLQAVWNYLHDLLKTVGGGAEATWRRANRLTLFDLDPEMELAAGEEEALSDAIEDVVHGYKSFARTRGVTPRDLTGTVPAINANARTIEELIAAASGVPHRILFGSERGELASSQDRSNWNDRVSERRREFATPLLGAFLARLIEHGGLPKPESWEAVWPAEDELDETEKAEVVSSFATANKAQVQATGRPVMTSNEIRDSILGLGPLEAIDDFESESEPEPDDEPGIDDVDEVEELRAAADLADREAEEPEWRSVHRAADVHRRGLARLFSESWRDAGQEIDLAALEILLGVGAETRAGDLVVEALARAERSLSAALPTRLLSVVAEGGLAALRSARSRGSWFRAAEFSMSFDAAHPRAEQWAEARAAALIVEVRPEIIAAVRELIVTGLREGVPPRVLAQRIRQSVGLRADQVEAVGNLITELQAAQPGAVVERFAPRKGVRASAGFRARVPVGGATDDWVARQAARYSSMQRNYRARTIARTETLRAANEGQRELWRQGQETGTLDGDQKRVWIATPDDRTRPEHAERDGVEVGIDEPWPWGTEPGEEVNCILPGALVSGAFVGGLKARYAGPAVEILTNRGYRLRLTPNHPVLTARGWQPAKAIKEGDQLVSYRDEVEVGTGRPSALWREGAVGESLSLASPSVGRVGGPPAHDDQAPTAVEQVFEALALQREPCSRTASVFDLHGDAQCVVGEIDVVGADSELVREPIAAVAHGGSQRELLGAGVSHALEPGLRLGDLRFETDDAPPAGVPCRSELAADGFAVALDPLPLQKLRLGPAADFDTAKPEPAGEDVALDAAFVRELLHRHAAFVASDQVIEVRDFDFLGHVYDLQTVTGWMIAGGIVISNCRCAQGLSFGERAREAA